MYGTVLHLFAKIDELSNRSGKRDDIVLGYDTPAEYETGTSYFGAIGEPGSFP